MANGDPISGKSGTLKINTTEAKNITNWKIAKKAASSRFATNTSNGWKRTVAGTSDWTGSFEQKVTAGTPIPIKVGQAYPMTFHIDKTPTDYYSGTGVVTQIDGPEADMNDGKELGYSVTVEGDGELLFFGTLLADVVAGTPEEPEET